MNPEIIRRISQDLNLPLAGTESTLGLLEAGATIPFIARFRKDDTGNLNETEIGDIADRYRASKEMEARREGILARLSNKGVLTDDLEARIKAASFASELEDLYLPFRPRREPRAAAARGRGLEALADYIQQQSGEKTVEEFAVTFVNPEKEVPTAEAAINGALDIIAERIAENAAVRQWLRHLLLDQGVVHSWAARESDNKKPKYSAYHDFRESVARIPSHRFLAVRRGTREKALTYSIELPADGTRQQYLERLGFRADCPWLQLLERAADDAWTRLLEPSIQSEVRSFLRARAEAEAIRVFRENLGALLLAPPAGQVPILGIEPGRTTLRIAAVDRTGALLETQSIRFARPLGPEPAVRPPVADPPAIADLSGNASARESATTPEAAPAPPDPTPQPTESAAPAGAPQSPFTEARTLAADSGRTADATDPTTDLTIEDASGGTTTEEATGAGTQPAEHPPAGQMLLDLIARHEIHGIAIGNGKGAREAEGFVRQTIGAGQVHVFVVVVSDAGAGTNATRPGSGDPSDSPGPEFQKAMSIARRLQDPLAELVRVDPKTIGVGQYQHDVNQNRLRASLGITVESAVNRVGVDLNTASPDLLRYVSGIGDSLAQAIVEFRSAQGSFRDRQQLLGVPGLDEKTFGRCAGFLRIADGTCPLDRSFIHPESYAAVERMATSIGVPAGDLVGHPDRVRQVRFGEFEKELGPFTTADIRRELLNPGRDPRGRFVVPRFREDVRSIGDLKDGMELEGQVTNVTNFGAFVDIGIHQDGLIHISELAHQYISDARQAIRVGDLVRVRVIGVDSDTRRISLSRKALMEKPQPRAKPRPAPPQKRDPTAGPARPDSRGPREKRPTRGSWETRNREKTRNRTTSRKQTPDQTPGRPPEPPSPPMSMEEKIRRLQEKFRSPDR